LFFKVAAGSFGVGGIIPSSTTVLSFFSRGTSTIGVFAADPAFSAAIAF